jgi:hypothetical protein
MSMPSYGQRTMDHGPRTMDHGPRTTRYCLLATSYCPPRFELLGLGSGGGGMGVIVRAGGGRSLSFRFFGSSGGSESAARFLFSAALDRISLGGMEILAFAFEFWLAVRLSAAKAARAWSDICSALVRYRSASAFICGV